MDASLAAAEAAAAAAAAGGGERAGGGSGSSSGGMDEPGPLRLSKSGMPYRERTRVLADLSTPGQFVLVARGGSAGEGNRGSKLTYSEQREDTERSHVRGSAGEVRFLELELRVIADVGLVGFPNAGKSSLLAALSKARPKIASYPFTTLHPHVGAVRFGDGASFTVADIPGLVEGAHADRGLGHEFLRHIERCTALAFVVDAAGASGAGADPVGDLEALRAELALYRADLPARPSLVLANKMDVGGPAERGLARLREATSLPVLPVSAITRQGIPAAAESLRWLLQSVRGPDALLDRGT